MARIKFNPAVSSLSGKLGDITYRHYPDGTVIAARTPRPDPNRRSSPSQLAWRQRFKDAAVHYKLLLQDPATRAAYEHILAARGPMARLNALVMGDIVRPPTITTLDLSAYTGHAWDVIRILAEDNVAVAHLALAIHDCATGQIVEIADTLPGVDHLAPLADWRYTTRNNVHIGHAVEVCVTVCDLAGNQAEASQVLQSN